MSTDLIHAMVSALGDAGWLVSFTRDTKAQIEVWTCEVSPPLSGGYRFSRASGNTKLQAFFRSLSLSVTPLPSVAPRVRS